MFVCFLAFIIKNYKEFVLAAIDLGQVLAERKIYLVYGGGDWWFLRLISEAAYTWGSQVLSIISKTLNHADTFIFLPRALVILEALITFASWAHLNIYQNPIDFFNVNNFYDGLITFLNHIIKNHFILSTIKQLFLCAPIINELIDLLQVYIPKLDPRPLYWIGQLMIVSIVVAWNAN